MKYQSWYRFTLVCSDKLAFYALAGRMGEIGLLFSGLDRWTGQTGQTGQDGGGMEGAEVAGAGSEAP